MKVPMKWLKEYVDINMPAEEYASRMVMTGTAVEGVEKTGAQFDKVVVGYVLSCVDHPNSDHLHICMVDVGEAEPIQIVCGAPNVHAGMRVAAALDGAHLPGGVKIKKGKMRGEVSMGMLCSGPELDVPAGLYPHIGDAGIIEIFEDVKPGTDVKEVFGLGDDIIDFEILANRPDCLSVWGLARESSAVLEEHFVMPEIAVEETGEGTFDDYAKVEVRDEEACPRYCARVITDVKIGPSPKWMREYLYGAGVRPINNIVDITNFVMLETGHPMHAFDLSKVKDQTIVVRRANPGEHADHAGRQGARAGRDDAGHRRQGERHRPGGHHGRRGERDRGRHRQRAVRVRRLRAGQQPRHRPQAGHPHRVLGPLREGRLPRHRHGGAGAGLHAGEHAGVRQGGARRFDHYPNPKEPVEIEASVSRICRRIGVDVPGEVMEDILNRLYIDTTVAGDALHCEVPAFRQDMEGRGRRVRGGAADVRLRPHPLHADERRHHGRPQDAKTVFNNRVKDALVGMGLYEVLNYSFISPRWIDKLGLAEDDPRRNAGEAAQPAGRGYLRHAHHAGAQHAEHRGREPEPRHPRRHAVRAEQGVRARGEGRRAAHREERAVRGRLRRGRGLLHRQEHRGVAAGEVRRHRRHRGRGRRLLPSGPQGGHDRDGVKLAALGEIHPDVAEAFDIKGRVYVAEVDLDALMPLEKDFYGIKPLPKFPAVSRDIAVVVDEAVGAGTMMDAIRAAAGKLLEDAKLFDIYRGEKLGAGRKSVAYAITLRAPGPHPDRRGDQRHDGQGAEGAEDPVRGGAEGVREWCARHCSVEYKC